MTNGRSVFGRVMRAVVHPDLLTYLDKSGLALAHMFMSGAAAVLLCISFLAIAGDVYEDRDRMMWMVACVGALSLCVDVYLRVGHWHLWHAQGRPKATAPLASKHRRRALVLAAAWPLWADRRAIIDATSR